MTTAISPRPRAASAAPMGAFRADVQGLRALAVTPVVLFHAGVGALAGGYTGVDVFYVISGFLITTHLLAESARTGTVRLREFWARRLRRLAPALAAVVLLTLPVALLVSSPLVWGDIGRQAVASVLYVSNLLFATQSTDYFADDVSSSPYLHTWSLGVEEQFYLVWPVLLVACLAAMRRLGRGRADGRQLVLGVFVAVFVVSLALSVVVTPRAESYAFYTLPTRAWEFAAGALVACMPVAWRRMDAVSGGFLSLVGVVVLAFGYMTLDEATPFPGTAALVPVLGTVLVLVGGFAGSGSWGYRALSVGPLQWIGTVSYSWYLWHWPLIVLATAAISDAVAVKLAAAAVSLGAAWLSYRFVESPLRFSPRLVGSTRRTLGMAIAGVAAVAVVAGAGVAAARVVTSEQDRTFEAARGALPSDACPGREQRVDGARFCVLGAVGSQRTVLALGDSHAAQWEEALDAAGRAEGVQVWFRWKRSCPVTGLRTVNTNGLLVQGCATFAEQSRALARRLRPDGVVLAQALAYDGRILSDAGGRLGRAEQVALWRERYTGLLRELWGNGARVAVIEDNPRMSFDPNLCATRLWSSVESCTPSRLEALRELEALRRVDREVFAGQPPVALMTTVDRLCGADSCSIVDGGVPVYRDDNHLSRQWTATQVPRVRALLRAAAPPSAG